MKKIHLISLIAIAIAVAVLVSASADFGTYSNFQNAIESPNSSHRIMGNLLKEKEIYYDPAKDPNYFSFYIRDKKGVERKVIFKGQKPQDFERSEGIVFQGKMVGEEFVAESLQLKCPSKYDDSKAGKKDVKTYTAQ